MKNSSSKLLQFHLQVDSPPHAVQFPGNGIHSLTQLLDQYRVSYGVHSDEEISS